MRQTYKKRAAYRFTLEAFTDLIRLSGEVPTDAEPILLQYDPQKEMVYLVMGGSNEFSDTPEGAEIRHHDLESSRLFQKIRSMELHDLVGKVT